MRDRAEDSVRRDAFESSGHERDTTRDPIGIEAIADLDRRAASREFRIGDTHRIEDLRAPLLRRHELIQILPGWRRQLSAVRVLVTDDVEHLRELAAVEP